MFGRFTNEYRNDVLPILSIWAHISWQLIQVKLPIEYFWKIPIQFVYVYLYLYLYLCIRRIQLMWAADLESSLVIADKRIYIGLLLFYLYMCVNLCIGICICVSVWYNSCELRTWRAFWYPRIWERFVYSDSFSSCCCFFLHILVISMF